MVPRRGEMMKAKVRAASPQQLISHVASAFIARLKRNLERFGNDSYSILSYLGDSIKQATLESPLQSSLFLRKLDYLFIYE
jgi:hypothetical protein